MGDIAELTKKDTSTKEKKQNEIVVYNDDHNTFDFVIASFMEILEHTSHQAEQCTIIIHHNGKCGVKTGEYDDLIPQCTALLENGINAEIQ